MKEGQVFKADDGSQVRVESIEEVFYPFDDVENFVRARLLVTVGGRLKEAKKK